MNKLGKTVISSVIGTSFMTASSALLSLLPNEEFREPDQLEKYIGRILPMFGKKANVIAGWGAHYAMGFVFAAVYVELWERKEIEHSIRNAVILGIVSGIIGLFIWKLSFDIHPLPPNNRKLDFYLQRIPAHVVFAVFTTIGYHIIDKNTLSENKLRENRN